MRRDFPDALWEDVWATLPSPSSFPSETPVERVLLAIIALAQGSLERLSQLSAEALKDWRDPLYWHEYPRDADSPKTYAELRKRLGLPDQE